MPRRHLTEFEVARLVTLLEEGHSQRYVANSIGVSPSVVNRLYARFRETELYSRRTGQGRRRATSSREDRRITRHALREPIVIARVIAGQFMNHRHNPPRPISNSTIRRRLRDVDLRSRRPVRVPLLTRTHQRQRLAYARHYVHWGQRQWANVLFTDESRFCLHGNDRRVRVWRRRGERHNANHTRPVVAFNGGSVMVWAGVTRYSRTPLIVLPPGGLTAARYVDEILRPVVLPLRQRMGNRFVLMQDNARAHTARHTLRFLRQNRISVLGHPSVSPDLNPIEHV